MTILLELLTIYVVIMYMLHVIVTVGSFAVIADETKRTALIARQRHARATKALLITLPLAPISLPVLILRWLNGRIYAE